MVSLGKWKAREEELGFSGQGNSNNAEGRRSGRGKGDLKQIRGSFGGGTVDEEIEIEGVGSAT